jgi:hypothetical protein
MALEADVVLRAHFGHLVVEQLRLDELEGAKPERERGAEFEEVFVAKWRERVEP